MKRYTVTWLGSAIDRDRIAKHVSARVRAGSPAHEVPGVIGGA